MLDHRVDLGVLELELQRPDTPPELGLPDDQTLQRPMLSNYLSNVVQLQ